MKCNRCTRRATQKNQRYFPDEWLCTFHANIETRKGRIAKKINNATHRAESVEIQVKQSSNHETNHRTAD
jgi:hypothetical protein